MNRQRVLFLLGGAGVLLDRLIAEMNSDREHDGFPALIALLPLVYCKLNQAWNERTLSDEIVEIDGGEKIPRDLPGIMDLI